MCQAYIDKRKHKFVLFIIIKKRSGAAQKIESQIIAVDMSVRIITWKANRIFPV